jgi:hypothetical protein
MVVTAEDHAAVPGSATEGTGARHSETISLRRVSSLASGCARSGDDLLELPRLQVAHARLAQVRVHSQQDHAREEQQEAGRKEQGEHLEPGLRVGEARADRHARPLEGQGTRGPSSHSRP